MPQPRVGGRWRLDFTMQPVEVTEQISVVAGAARLLETGTSSHGQAVGLV